MTPEELIIKELRLLCNQMNVENMAESSSRIFKLGRLFIDHPSLKQIAIRLWQKQKNDYAPLNAALKKISNKMFPLCIAVDKYVRNHNITNPNIVNELPNLKHREPDNANTILVQWCAIHGIFKTLLHDPFTDHREFIRMHATIDESNPLQPITLHISINRLKEALYKLHRVKEAQDWYSLKQILSFCLIYDPEAYEELTRSIRKRHPINQLIFAVRYKALESVIGPVKNPHIREDGFNPRLYQKHMEQLCHHAESELSLVVSSVEPKKQPSWKYDATNGEFSSSTGKHGFRNYRVPEDKKRPSRKGREGYGYSRPFIDRITKDAKSRKTKWSSLNVCEIINYPGSDESGRRVMYDMCVHINQSILEKCGIKDFLIFDMDFVHINPEYLN